MTEGQTERAMHRRRAAKETDMSNEMILWLCVTTEGALFVAGGGESISLCFVPADWSRRVTIVQ